MLNAIVIVASKITSHCAGTVQIREESESEKTQIFKTTAEDGEREGQQ